MNTNKNHKSFNSKDSIDILNRTIKKNHYRRYLYIDYPMDFDEVIVRVDIGIN